MSQQLLQPFNAAAIDPTQGAGFKPLMLGKYPCRIVASEIKPNSGNTGGMVVFEVEAIAGEHAGKTGQWMLNLYHPDDQTRSIAERTLSAICHATQQFLITSTAALHGLQFAIDVVEQQLTPKQQDDKAAGKNVTPFRNVRVLMADGSDVLPQGQQAPAPQAQPPAAAPAQQWAAQAPAQAPAPAAGAWGGAAPAQPPAQAPAPAAGGWAQGGGQSAPPANAAWGKR